MKSLLLLAVLALGACGVKGPPIPPDQVKQSQNADQSSDQDGVTMHGYAYMGASKTF